MKREILHSDPTGGTDDIASLEAWTAHLNQEAALRLTPEVQQIEDLGAAYTQLEAFIADPDYQFGEDTIKSLHRTLAPHIPHMTGSLGEYYTAPRRIISALPWDLKPFVQGKDKIPAMAQLGKDFGDYMQVTVKEPEDIEAVVTNAVDTLTRLEDIHPFFDGNGRTGRLLVDGIFLKAGLHQVPYWIKPEIGNGHISAEKLRFFRMVEDSRLGDSQGLTQLLVQEQMRAIGDEIAALTTDPRTRDLPETNVEVARQREYLAFLAQLSRE
jgi:fido (protein-threonine AMPylation protein)